MKRKLAAVLILATVAMACNASQVQAYVNLAVGIALQVAKLAGLPASVATQVSSDLATANKLIADYQAADAKAKPGLLNEIDTYLQVAQTDLSGLLAAAHVVDPKLQDVIEASIGIAMTAVESIYQLENSRPSNALVKTAHVAVRISTAGTLPNGKPPTPAQLKDLYNATVAAYPQARLN